MSTLRRSACLSLVVVVFLCASLNAHAHRVRAVESQHATTSLRANAMTPQQQIITQALKGTRVYERLAFMCDTFGPRFSGTQALENAIDWISDEVKADGLRVTLEPVQVPVWVRGNEYLKMTKPRTANLRMLGLGMSIGTHGKPIRAPILVVKNFDELKSKKAEAVGKIIVFNAKYVNYFETVSYRVHGAVTAASYGAIAALVRSVAPYSLDTPHTGTSIPADIPAASITLEDADMFQRMQDRGQEVELELYMEAERHPDKLSRNVVIDLIGSEKPEEVVVIGGHIDSWDVGQGAIDDGGGAFSSWEALRLMKELNIQPKRTVRAVLFTNEENGAMGGQTYHRDHISEMNRTSFALETDGGTFTPYGISFSGHDAAYSILADIGQKHLSDIGAGNVTKGGGGTDIGPMCDDGVPCAALIVLDPFTYKQQGEIPDGYFWFHHTPADTITAINPAQLDLCAASLAVWAYSIADLETLLPRTDLDAATVDSGFHIMDTVTARVGHYLTLDQYH
eukprot:GILJ01005649.1.p1 GENE.GILJ01005649.1~~GILJ01005649.1.p1  ORF type:complete len:510 (-),score=81.93 GILJ01005649.1:214-1743(-)